MNFCHASALCSDDLHFMAAFHAKKLAELGSPLHNALAWQKFILDFPAAFRTLVKQLHVVEMPLDGSSSRSAVVAPCIAPRSSCDMCDASFHSLRALQAHVRVRHAKRAPVAQFVGTSPICQVCSVPFASRMRLLANLTEKRLRGRRLISCGDVVRKGFVKPVSEGQLAKACAMDRAAHTSARKRGHMQPLAEWPAKRLCSAGFLAAASIAVRASPAFDGSCAPENLLGWTQLRPVKRLRSKSVLDSLLARGEAAL